MSLLNLAIGGQFIEIGSITAPPKTFYYQVDFDVPFLADLIRIQVTLPQEIPVDWHRAGYIRQRWNSPSGKTSVLKAARVYLRDAKIVQIEPVINSVIEFHPVGWLHGWTCTLEARSYNSSPELITLDKLGQIEQKIDQLL